MYNDNYELQNVTIYVWDDDFYNNIIESRNMTY